MTGDKPKVEDVEDDAGASASDLDIAIEVETDDSVDDGSIEVVDDGSGDEAAVEAEQAADEGDARTTELETALAELETKQKQTYERLLRTTADFDNFRRRSKRDQEDARVDAKTKVLREMLPVIDNLERAVEHSGGAAGNGAAGILDGVKLVLRQFAGALEKCDVVAVEALGEPFDPNLHEAIGQIETDDYEPGACGQVLQRGYKIGTRLLRPSLVVVAKAVVEREPKPEADAAPEAEASADTPAEAEASAEAPADGDKSGQADNTEAAESSDDANSDDAGSDDTSAEAAAESATDADDDGGAASTDDTDSSDADAKEDADSEKEQEAGGE